MLRWNGRPFNARAFARDIEAKMLDAAMSALEERVVALASSMVDPSSSLHPLTVAWRAKGNQLMVYSSGSDVFALALERRLTNEGILTTKKSDTERELLVYLAHASEDKAAVRPIANYLLANGIDVWFDEWEIKSGDSLRRKMDEGLGRCTHFVVVLSPISLLKPWVNEEIDAGFVQKVSGEAKFLPMRLDLPVSSLPPLMKAMLSPEIDPHNELTLKRLVDDIHSVSSKPQLGLAPRYVRRISGLDEFSATSIAVGKVMVEKSEAAGYIDQELELSEISEISGLSTEDVELGVLDLVEAGLLEESNVIGSTSVWPLHPLFIKFDEHFMGWSPMEDAQELAARMINGGKSTYVPEELAAETGWAPRRLNAALAAVKAAKLARTETYMGSEYIVSELDVTPQTRRAARDRATPSG